MGTLAALQAGCTGPQVRPASEPCPQEAVAAAKELGFQVTSVCIDQTQPCKREHAPWLKEGALTGRTMRAAGKVPAGSLLFGELKFTNWGGATMRYTLLELPNGKRYPVCVEGVQNGVAPGKDGAIQLIRNLTEGDNHAGSAPEYRPWNEAW